MICSPSNVVVGTSSIHNKKTQGRGATAQKARSKETQTSHKQTRGTQCSRVCVSPTKKVQMLACVSDVGSVVFLVVCMYVCENASSIGPRMLLSLSFLSFLLLLEWCHTILSFAVFPLSK